MEAIVAVFSDWGIGSEGTQQVVLKADRRHFRELTDGAAVLVGRRTLGDFPGGKPLKGRYNIVLTRQAVEIEGAEVVHRASVYRQMMPYVDTVHLTQINLCPKSDRFFPDLDAAPDWRCLSCDPWLEEDGIPYRFATYVRIKEDD